MADYPASIESGRRARMSARGAFRMVISVLVLVITLTGGMAVAAPSPAEAAFQAKAPTMKCSRIVGYGGSISFYTFVYASGSRIEVAALSYRIDRRVNGSWRAHRAHSGYLFNVYPVGSKVITFHPVNYVRYGTYRLVVALAWNENGRVRNWAGTVGSCTF